jgi:hypothetical protein
VDALELPRHAGASDDARGRVIEWTRLAEKDPQQPWLNDARRPCLIYSAKREIPLAVLANDSNTENLPHSTDQVCVLKAGLI